MGTQKSSNFDMNAQMPLDSKLYLNASERNNLPIVKQYKWMVVIDKNNGGLYQLQSTPSESNRPLWVNIKNVFTNEDDTPEGIDKWEESHSYFNGTVEILGYKIGNIVYEDRNGIYTLFICILDYIGEGQQYSPLTDITHWQDLDKEQLIHLANTDSYLSKYTKTFNIINGSEDSYRYNIDRKLLNIIVIESGKPTLYNVYIINIDTLDVEIDYIIYNKGYKATIIFNYVGTSEGTFNVKINDTLVNDGNIFIEGDSKSITLYKNGLFIEIDYINDQLYLLNYSLISGTNNVSSDNNIEVWNSNHSYLENELTKYGYKLNDIVYFNISGEDRLYRCILAYIGTGIGKEPNNTIYWKELSPNSNSHIRNEDICRGNYEDNISIGDPNINSRYYNKAINLSDKYEKNIIIINLDQDSVITEYPINTINFVPKDINPVSATVNDIETWILFNNPNAYDIIFETGGNLIFNSNNITTNKGYVAILCRRINSLNKYLVIDISDINFENYYTIKEISDLLQSDYYTITDITNLLTNYSLSDHNHTILDISSFEITDPILDQTLKYDGTKWINSTNNSGGLVNEDILYADLVTKISNSELTANTYTITDYQTVSTDDNITDDNQYGAVEHLVLTVLSPNTLSPVASSIEYPNDIVYYSVDPISVTDEFGTIYRRINITNNVDVCFDFRAKMVVRYYYDTTAVDYQYTSINTTNTPGQTIKYVDDQLYVLYAAQPNISTANFRDRSFQLITRQGKLSYGMSGIIPGLVKSTTYLWTGTIQAEACYDVKIVNSSNITVQGPASGLYITDSSDITLNLEGDTARNNKISRCNGIYINQTFNDNDISNVNYIFAAYFNSNVIKQAQTNSGPLVFGQCYSNIITNQFDNIIAELFIGNIIGRISDFKMYGLTECNIFTIRNITSIGKYSIELCRFINFNESNFNDTSVNLYRTSIIYCNANDLSGVTFTNAAASNVNINSYSNSTVSVTLNNINIDYMSADLIANGTELGSNYHKSIIRRSDDTYCIQYLDNTNTYQYINL